MAQTHMDVTEMYESEMSHPDRIYRRGVMRGFHGAVAVPDVEHLGLMDNADPGTAASYRMGLHSGQNLRLWALMKPPATRNEPLRSGH